MLDTAEIDELRTLQARAYGRGGGLTDADAERLRELEGARGTRPVGLDPVTAGGRPPKGETPGAGDGALPIVSAVPLAPGSQAPVRDAKPEPAGVLAPADGEPPTAASARPSPPWRWRTVAIGAVAMVVAGLGLGWLLFGDRDVPAMTLTAEQQVWEDELLATAEYDPGSLRALAEEEGVVVWYATKKERELSCVILSDGNNTRPSCTTADAIAAEGLYGQFRTPAGEDEREVSAQVILDAEGDPAATVSSQLLGGNSIGMTYASVEETGIAATLTEAGFEPGSIWVVGYDGDVPLWAAMRPAESQQCLIYDGSDPDPVMACVDTEKFWSDGGSLTLDHVDAETGDVTRFDYVFGNGPAYLTVTKGIEPGDAPD